MFTGKTGMAYGVEMPMQRYNLHWSCGCVTRDVEIACNSPLPDDAQMGVECPRCYKGPYANVWD